jgi:DNA-directed RNA polymerase sigma subunit (sigma70/sigma32)
MAAKLKSKQGLKDYLILLASLAPLGAEREAELLGLSRAGDAAALRELVEGYLPRVLHWVAPRRGEALSFQELIAIGNCALIDAAKAQTGGPFEEKACLAVHAALDTALKLGA